MTLPELQYKIEVGQVVEFTRAKDKYLIMGSREDGNFCIRFCKEFEPGQKYSSFNEFMEEARVGNQYLREYIRSV